MSALSPIATILSIIIDCSRHPEVYKCVEAARVSTSYQIMVPKTLRARCYLSASRDGLQIDNVLL